MKPDLHVVARLLECLARPHVQWTRSKLQAAVRLNYDLFRRYLELAAAKGWVEEGDAGQIRITGSGLRAWHDLQRWLREWLSD